jgi:RsiW-degrading membrane proteinase PrsW (M82 family)
MTTSDAAPPGPDPSGVARAPGRRRTVASVVGLSILIAVCALATIGIVLYFGSQFGPVALAVGIVGAILPVPVLIGCFLWLDRYQPAPAWLVLVCFLWGAGVATSVALIVNTLATKHISVNIVASVTAPITEETMKALLPLLLFAFYRKAFTGIIDGVVYCGLSATGFAMVENILYFGGNSFAQAADQGYGYAAGAFAASLTFVVRVLLSGFAHPLFTSMTGIGIGIAARSRRRVSRILFPLGGLLLAMTLHGSWNFMAVLSQTQRYFILYGYFSVYMPLFFTMVGLIVWVRSWEGRLAERILPAYAMAGWFSPPEVVALGTLARRLSARRWAQRVGGAAAQSAMKAYQVAATRLALLRDGLNRGLYTRPKDLDRALAEERDLLTSIDGARRAFAGRDPYTPWAWWNGSGYQIRFPDGVVRAVGVPPSPVLPLPITPPPPVPVGWPYGPYGQPAPYGYGPPQTPYYPPTYR